MSKFLFASALMFASIGTEALASRVEIRPGEEVTIQAEQTTTVRCESSGGGDLESGLCQTGHTICVGLQPGTLCEVGGGSRSYCVVTDFNPGGFRRCSCRSEN